MPASAGRVRMPHNNRMSSSAALTTSDIWKNVIKYDPYAGSEEKDAGAAADEAAMLEQQQGLMDVVKIKAREMGLENKRGACSKCGNVGHLTYQCRNHLGGLNRALGDSDSGSESSDSDSDASAAAAAAGARARAMAAAAAVGREGEGEGNGGGRKRGRSDSSSGGGSDSDSTTSSAEAERRRRRKEKKRRKKEEKKRKKKDKKKSSKKKHKK